MTTITAIEFVERVRALAGHLEAAYWLAKRVSREWYARPELGQEIAFNSDPILDGNEKALTNMDVYGVLNRADELVADYEAGNFAKLNTVIKASDLSQE